MQRASVSMLSSPLPLGQAMADRPAQAAAGQSLCNQAATHSPSPRCSCMLRPTSWTLVSSGPLSSRRRTSTQRHSGDGPAHSCRSRLLQVGGEAWVVVELLLLCSSRRTSASQQAVLKSQRGYAFALKRGRGTRWTHRHTPDRRSRSLKGSRERMATSTSGGRSSSCCSLLAGAMAGGLAAALCGQQRRRRRVRRQSAPTACEARRRLMVADNACTSCAELFRSALGSQPGRTALRTSWQTAAAARWGQRQR